MRNREVSTPLLLGLIGGAILIGILAAYLSAPYLGNPPQEPIDSIHYTFPDAPESSNPLERSASDKKPETMCLQVLTRASNPKTGETKTFPTPCDVPETWEIVQL